MDALRDGLDTSGLHRGQAFGQHGGEDVDHLAITVIDALQLAAHLLQGIGQHPVLEGRAVAQRPGLAH